jgi:hypothetical protein
MQRTRKGEAWDGDVRTGSSLCSQARPPTKVHTTRCDTLWKEVTENKL